MLDRWGGGNLKAMDSPDYETRAIGTALEGNGSSSKFKYLISLTLQEYKHKRHSYIFPSSRSFSPRKHIIEIYTTNMINYCYM